MRGDPTNSCSTWTEFLALIYWFSYGIYTGSDLRSLCLSVLCRTTPLLHGLTEEGAPMFENWVTDQTAYYVSFLRRLDYRICPIRAQFGGLGHYIGDAIDGPFCIRKLSKGVQQISFPAFNKQIISTYVLKLRSCKMWFKSIFIIFQYDRILPESDKKIWWITEWWSVSSDLITQERCKVIQSETTQHNIDYNNILPYTVIMVVTRC